MGPLRFFVRTIIFQNTKVVCFRLIDVQWRLMVEIMVRESERIEMRIE